MDKFQERKKCRLVLFPTPFQGHINPMIQLAKILHSKGFNISIIHTKYNFPNPSKYPYFTFHLISDGLPETQTCTPDVVLLIKLLRAKCEEPFNRCLAQLLAEDTDYPITCMITDGVWGFTQATADKFKVPRIVIRTSSICSFLAFVALPILRERGYLNKDAEMEDTISELPPLKVKDIPTIETDTPDDFYRITSNMVEQTKKASGLIFNTFKELEELDLARLNDQFLIPTFTIGPFHRRFSAASSSLLTQDQSSISWLNTQSPKSVLYVSFGSVASMDMPKLLEVAWGLANSMKPFLWVIRPGLVHGSESLPNEFLSSVSERSCIIKWAPQQEVLAHPAIGGFWTHCGWNSTLESICEGVPMICSPFFGDQMVNSRYINDVWRIGIRLEKRIERGKIEEVIRRLMVDKEGDKMRERVMRLKQKVDVCLNSGGSSYQALDGLVDFISSFKSSA